MKPMARLSIIVAFLNEEPNIVPLKPANTPRALYTTARPTTYDATSAAMRRREVPPTLCPPTIAAVIGIMG